MDIKYDHLEYLHLLWGVPLLLCLLVYSFSRKERALRRFATANLLAGLIPHYSLARQWLKSLLVVSAIVLLVLAATGPRWGKRIEELPRVGIDLMVCLDVSRSMLAEDTAPNRLERAKIELTDMLARARGDRVGLVTFAGAATLTCPLTINYGAYRMALREVDLHSAPRGGSLIGDAVRVATDSFSDQVKGHKAILLITDGEDQESLPVEAARDAYQQRKIRVFTVGLGKGGEGARIPITVDGRRQYLQYDGAEVWSRLDHRTLEAMAVEGGGSYFPVGTRDPDFAEIYERIRANVESREFESTRMEIYQAKYQWFAGAALLLLLLETLVSGRKRVATAIAGLVMALALPGVSEAAPRAVVEEVETANAAYAAGDYEAALEAYRRAEVDCPTCAEVFYNQALAHYRLRDFETAREQFNEALVDTRDLSLEAAIKYNLGNVAYAQALEKLSSLEEAIQLAQTAIVHYRDALEIDPEDADARANIEIAQLLIKDLLDKQKQQSEQQQQQNSSQDQQSQDQPSEDDQQQEEEQSEQPQQEGEQPQEGDEQQDRESQGEQEGQEGEAADEQQEAQPPADQQDEADAQQDPSAAQAVEAEPRELSEEEVEQILQAIRDKEAQRRDELDRRRQARRRPVARDW